MSIYDFKVKNSVNEDISMSDYKDKVVLIVNTASECGFTDQYEGLENLYEKHKEQGLEVVGFPCNQFGGQESGSDSEIQEFCQMKFGIKFPVYKKIEVNGENTHPLYKYLKEEAPGLLGSQKVKWNFTKFLVDKNGKVIKRYASTTKPESITADIVKLLNE
jgi:glutathione peroxidase